MLETNYGIIPKYTVKFIAYGGEEYGMIGAYHYEATHLNEHIITVIDLNQIGYNQSNPSSTFYFATNTMLYYLDTAPYVLRKIIDKVNYKERTGDVTNLNGLWTPIGSVSDEFVFAQARLPNFMFGGHDRTDLVTALFLKDTGWYRHHRTGIDYTEGDSLKYVDWNDVNVTAEMVYNITRYFALNPNCRYTPNSVTYTPFDGPDEDNLNNDSVNINFTITTQLPQDCTTICALLINYMCPILYCYLNTSDYAVTPTGITADFNVTLPRYAPPGWYWLKVYLLNSTQDYNYNDIYIY